MPLLARGPGFGIKRLSVLLALVTYFSMMQSKILSENWVFLSTFHRCLLYSEYHQIHCEINFFFVTCKFHLCSQ